MLFRSFCTQIRLAPCTASLCKGLPNYVRPTGQPEPCSGCDLQSEALPHKSEAFVCVPRLPLQKRSFVRVQIRPYGSTERSSAAICRRSCAGGYNGSRRCSVPNKSIAFVRVQLRPYGSTERSSAAICRRSCADDTNVSSQFPVCFSIGY